MLLIESDGKDLFKAYGIPVAQSFLMANADENMPLEGGASSKEWIVKAQVPVGGRGKAGGITVAVGSEGVRGAVQAMIGKVIKGHEVKACIIEQPITGNEHYLAIVVDAGQGGIRLMYSREGGMDIEEVAKKDGLVFQEVMPLDRHAFDAALVRLAEWIGDANASRIVDCARKLGSMFFELGLMVAEINPLFVDGHNVTAGDAKVVLDLNCINHKPALMGVLRRHQSWYPDVWRKVQADFDFIEVDPDGQIGLITTGAGLSMMLIDELIARNARPFNFADVRTGQMRGDPARLVMMFGWLQEARNVRSILINIFAGITDLEEFAETLIKALDQLDGWNVPIVARLIGNNEARARAILKDKASRVHFEPDLEKAMSLTIQLGEAA